MTIKPLSQRDPLYGWLAETAARILKQGGLCLAMCGQSFLPYIYSMMGNHLTYHWTFGMDTLGAACNVWNARIASQWKPILSYSKGRYIGRMFGTDKITSAMYDKRYHDWGQSVSSAFYFIERLEGLYFEPFCGGGTVPAVCKMLGRNYLAFEIDPPTAERARERVRNTQPPLFVVQPEQAAMELSA